MPSFIAAIVAPILSLDAKFVMKPTEREKAPLRKKPATGANHVDANNNAIKYEDTLRHALLHETFHAIGKDYDERDEKLANITLDVSTAQMNGEFQCTVPTERIIDLSNRMQRRGGRGKKGGKKQSADDAAFFIMKWSVGILGKDRGTPVLAVIKGCERCVECKHDLHFFLSTKGWVSDVPGFFS